MKSGPIVCSTTGKKELSMKRYVERGGKFYARVTYIDSSGKERQNIRMYDLRHTCATLLLAAGENPKVVSERLRHASIVLTLDTYSHCLPTMQKSATERLQKLLGK